MPSNAVLEAKKAKVDQLTELLKNSVAGVLVDYKGITVEEDTKLRKELREAGVNYFVEKNTMLLRAFKNVGIEDPFKGRTPRSARWLSPGSDAESRSYPQGSCRQEVRRSCLISVIFIPQLNLSAVLRQIYIKGDYYHGFREDHKIC